MNLWNNWTTYEKWTTVSLILLVILAVPALVWLFSKHSKLLTISFLSLLSTGILVLVSLVLLHQIFNIDITYTYKLVPFITFFINILYIGTMTGYYMQHRKQRIFEISEMKKDLVTDAFRLTVPTILLFTGFSVLTPSILIPMLLSLALSLCAIWIGYLLFYKLFK